MVKKAKCEHIVRFTSKNKKHTTRGCFLFLYKGYKKDIFGEVLTGFELYVKSSLGIDDFVIHNFQRSLFEQICLVTFLIRLKS